MIPRNHTVVAFLSLRHQIEIFSHSCSWASVCDGSQSYNIHENAWYNPMTLVHEVSMRPVIEPSLVE